VYLPEGALGGGEWNGISVVARAEEDVAEIARRLRTVWPVRDEAGFLPRRSVGVFVRRDWMDLVSATSQTGALLSNVVWMIIVGVAVVMVSTLNLLAIRERYDELAIRRVEGAGKDDVAGQVAIEGVLLSLVGGLAGLPLGFGGAVVLRGIVGFPFRFDVGTAAVATGVAILLGLLAAALPARHAAALDPVRVLTRRPT
jgi:putative ABC transport system permease protein